MPKQLGIVFAADVSMEKAAPIQQGECEPVAVIFRFRSGRREDFQVPVRDLVPEEIIAVVNRALAEGRMEFGFRPRHPGQGLIMPGH